MNFGEKLELLLDEHGMKQSEIGQKIGLASGNVSNWVNGVSMPKNMQGFGRNSKRDVRVR